MLRFTLKFLLLSLLTFETAFADEPTVVASIRPIQMITNEILGEIGSAELLIEESQNPHHSQLKPSQLRLLAKADLLIWVSNEFETSLQKLHGIADAKSQQLELLEQLPEAQRIGQGHDSDGHIWLSPENVISISQLITRQLIMLLPHHENQLISNQQRLAQKVSQWQAKTSQSFNNVKLRYILDHPFLNYFEQSFKLEHIGALRQLHDHGSSIRQLSHLHKQHKTQPLNCLLVSQLPISKQAKEFQQQHDLDLYLVDILNSQNRFTSIVELLDDISLKLLSCQSQ